MKKTHWMWLLLALALTPVLVFAAMLTYEMQSTWFPRIGLPAFDQNKAKLLTPEKRAAYEQELFSELQMWNMGSRKYPTLEDIKKREQRWQEMADDGFELAHITLQVLQPSVGRVYSLRGPMKRLEELAQQGDVGAMCLMPALVNVGAEDAHRIQYQERYQPWLLRGAELAHPECQKALGGRLLRGVSGFEKDARRGLELIFQARRAGYSHDVGTLVLHYMEKGFSNLEDVRRLYCWLSIEREQVWRQDSPEQLLRQIRAMSEAEKRPELTNLARELETQKFKLLDCVELGTGG